MRSDHGGRNPSPRSRAAFGHWSALQDTGLSNELTGLSICKNLLRITAGFRSAACSTMPPDLVGTASQLGTRGLNHGWSGNEIYVTVAGAYGVVVYLSGRKEASNKCLVVFAMIGFLGAVILRARLGIWLTKARAGGVWVWCSHGQVRIGCKEGKPGLRLV
ncbi:hypothetical protein B0T19DRAFT_80226 [Cercophora scortea]|uniref:Uncharacterized protein n=1 Tax=Cercophora scortea TaxID=314031 RepID=A0AAE0J641_9PEZI|nr:hypothetical protein B0T19DRAFT_80226 [Cercophora scortea]